MTGRGEPITVVLAASGDRAALHRSARSILAQDHSGPIELIVAAPAAAAPGDLPASRPGRAVRGVPNVRRTGIAGQLASGILIASSDVVGFCLEGDIWDTDKLRRQLAVWEQQPDALIVGSASRGGSAALWPSRMQERLSTARHARESLSTLLVRRGRLLAEVGLPDRLGPSPDADGRDLLARAREVGLVVASPRALVRLRDTRGSVAA